MQTTTQGRRNADIPTFRTIITALPLLILSLFPTPTRAEMGVQAWVQSYNGPGNGYDVATAVAVDGSNNLFVAGYSHPSMASTNSAYVTIKYSSAGTPLWTNRYEGPASGNDSATAIAVDGNHDVVVTGFSASTNSEPYNYGYATIKYSRAGMPLWTNRYHIPGNNSLQPSTVVVDGSNDVIVTGYSFGNGPSEDGSTIKYSSAGVPLWTNRFGAGSGRDGVYGMAVDSSNNVIVTGFSATSLHVNDYATIRYSSAGVPLWTNRYSGPQNGPGSARAVAVDHNNDILVTGQSASRYVSGYDLDYVYATIKYSSTGVPVWTNRFHRLGDGDDKVNAVAVDAVLRNSPVDPRCRFEANRSSGIAAVLREGTAATWEEVVLRRRSAANLEELRAVLDSGRVYQADLEGPYGIKGFCT